MYCKNCGKKLKENEEYCSNCGQGKNEPVTKTVSASNTKVKNKNASLSVGFGIGCIVASFFISVLCIPFGIVSIVYFMKAKKEGETNPVGLMLSIVGMVIGVLILIFWILFVNFVFDMIDREMDRNDYKRSYERYDYNDYEYDDYDGKLKSTTVSSYLEIVKANDEVATVIISNSCNNCHRFLDHADDVADDIHEDIYFFNIDTLSTTDKQALTNTFPSISSNTTYPYTFVTKNNKITKEIKGYTSERELESTLLNAGVGYSDSNFRF